MNLLLDCALYSREKSISWSDEQSYINWNDAEAMCRKQGMRLPDYREMSFAMKSKITEEWRKTINLDVVLVPSFWLSSNDKRDARIFPIHIPDEGVPITADKKTKKLVRCIIDLEMEERIKASKPIANWSGYKGFMRYNAAEQVCSEIGMSLPTDKKFRNAYFERITNSWVAEFNSEGIAYWVKSKTEKSVFHPRIGIYAFANGVNGNQHVRCIKNLK